MFDFSDLLIFLKSIFDAIMAFAKKLGFDIAPAEEGSSDTAADA